MTDVTPDDVNLAILPALSMSESVYRSAQMLYKLIFTAAEDSNVIKKSPCSKLSAKGGKPQKVKKALSDEQVEKLCQVQSWKRRSMSVGFPHAP